MKRDTLFQVYDRIVRPFRVVHRFAPEFRGELYLSPLFLILFIAGGLALSGCGTSEEETKAKEAETAKESMAKAEENFNPSLYDQDVEAIKREVAGNAVTEGGKKPDAATPTDTIAGFRVQVLFTQDIEKATELRDSLNVVLPTEYIYVVYDQPYYKVRIGNYTDKLAADAMARSLMQKGYTDVWAVPDKIVTNLPEKKEQ